MLHLQSPSAIYITAFCAVCTLVFGCSSGAATPSPEVSNAASKQQTKGESSADAPLRIGVYLPFTGEESAFGVDTRDGIELALSRIVDSGGIRGRAIELVYADDHSRPRDASDAVLGLASDPSVIAIIGEISSARSKAGGIVANKLGVPMLTPGSTNPDVTRIGPFVFRGCIDDAAQGATAASYLVQTRKHKKIGVLWQDDDLYSSLLAREFRNEVKRLGATLFESRFTHKETDFKEELGDLRTEHVDVIYMPLYYNIVPSIVRDAKSIGFSGRNLFGGDGWTSETLPKEAGAGLVGAEFTTQWLIDIPSDENRAFVDAYRGRFHRDPSNLSAVGYDAARLVVDAIKRAKSDDRDGVRDALGTTREFQGVTGKLTMGADRNPEMDVVIARVEGGRFRFQARVRSVSAP